MGQPSESSERGKILIKDRNEAGKQTMDLNDENKTRTAPTEGHNTPGVSPHQSQRMTPSAASQVALGNLIFFSRWLQAPLYVGLILAQMVYVYHFMVELWHLFERAGHITETDIMLTVLGLIDVVMIANLLIMVIVGGYETFVSRLNLQGHPDQPEWLSHVNAGVLKVKLATALIGISSIHLLKTFINSEHVSDKTIMYQIAIHLTFVGSALALAITDRISTQSTSMAKQGH
jgi:uncharacterized protein (TIGR00645 family)